MNLTGLSPANTFNINVWSLSGTNSGTATNFDANISQSWTIATVLGGITGFTANDFTINTVATNGTGGFGNSLNGTFGITNNSGGLLLTYTALNSANTDLYLGSNSPNTSTNFTSGTKNFGTIYQGYAAGSSNNLATVGGAGTSLVASGNLYVGYQGSANHLSNRAVVSDSYGSVSYTHLTLPTNREV